MKEHNDIYTRIQEFETKENVSNFNSEFGNLWPIFRMHIFNTFFGNKNTFLKYKNGIYRAGSKIKQLIIEQKKYKFKKNKKNVTNKLVDEIWFSNYELRRNNKQNFNKYLDPFFLKLSSKRALFFEKANDKPDCFSYPHFEHQEINNLKPTEIKYKITSLIKLIKFNIGGYNKFIKKYKINKLIEKFPEYNAYSFYHEYLRFIEGYSFIHKLLEKYPKVTRIYILSYYFTDNMAIVASAHKQNIQVVEIQHGMQSAKHYGYGSWNYIPKKGFELLPSLFFVFSDYEKKIILKGLKNRHKVEIIGDLAFDFWLSKQNKTKSNKNIIVVSLQNTIIENNHFLYKALKIVFEKNKNIRIVFRLHPRHTYIKNEMDEILKKQKFNFFWDENNDIFDTLSKSLMHITSYSSVVEDAFKFNIPSIIIDKVGVDFFYEKIKDSKLINSALNLDAILELMKNYKIL